MEMRKEKKNTGPNTPNGKAHSSQNSTKHGLRSNPRKKLLPDEKQAEVDAIRKGWEAEFDCDSPAIESLLTPLIEADRMLRRATTALFEAEIALCQPGLTEEQLNSRHKQYQLILRYKTSHERSFRNALRTLEQFTGRRAREERAQRRQIIFEKRATVEIAAKLIKYNIDPKTLFAPVSRRTQPEPHTPEPQTPEPEPDPLL